VACRARPWSRRPPSTTSRTGTASSNAPSASTRRARSRSNDGGGRVDAVDPGCNGGPADESEHSLALVCDDRLDNDGDGLPDYPRDPDCLDPTQATELPEPGELLMLAAGVAAPCPAQLAIDARSAAGSGRLKRRSR
jgi:hypothetical protein